MGFFSRPKKTTVDEIAESLTGLAMHSISHVALQPFRTLLKEMNECEEIDERQRKEILILEMLATTRAVLATFGQGEQRKQLLDSFHTRVFANVSASEDDQTSFQATVVERYQVYNQLLDPTDTFLTFSIGKQFADYLLRRDVQHDGLVLITSSGEILLAGIATRIGFLKDILSTHQLTG